MTYRGPGGSGQFAPRLHQPGFWRMTENPIIVMGTHCKISNRDVDLMRAFWIVSERCRDAMTSVDASAFEFLECECYDSKGKVLERRWLCAVMRTLDVLDEQATNVTISRGNNNAKGYSISPYDDLVFKNQSISKDVHIFNMAHIVRNVIVDGQFKSEMKRNGIKNFSFDNVSNRKRKLRYR